MRLESYLIEASGRTFHIYVDMDGVLADFKASFKKISGKTTEEVDKEDTKGNQEAFWEYVDKGGLEFWSEMPWIKGSKKLWNYVKNKDVAILSAPARRLPNSIRGKQLWVGRELGSPKLILKRAREKKEYATKDSILIDDYKKNIQQWKSAGGIGILFKNADQAIKELKKLGV